jgi:hypothetical protein
LPYVVVGCVCLLAGLLVQLMPETLGQDMPECIEVGVFANGHKDITAGLDACVLC